MADQATEKTAAMDLNADGPQEPSKNALKKAAKQEKLAAEKAEKAKKAAAKPAQDHGNAEAKKEKAPKKTGKEVEGAELKSVNVAKEADFSTWYSQVLTKGDMISYTQISGCYVYRVR